MFTRVFHRPGVEVIVHP